MFVTMRRYSPKNGAVNKASLELLRRQIHDEFIPIIEQVPGFRAYYVLNVDNREVVTLSFCDTLEGSAESTRCAAEYTLRNPLVYELGRPEVTECEVLTHAESPQETASGEASNGEDAMAAAIALWLKESRGMLLSIPEQ
jgi:heme-degrading monooxygenase HmoA